jgi:hypothetical protein
MINLRNGVHQAFCGAYPVGWTKLVPWSSKRIRGLIPHQVNVQPALRHGWALPLKRNVPRNVATRSPRLRYPPEFTIPDSRSIAKVSTDSECKDFACRKATAVRS